MWVFVAGERDRMAWDAWQPRGCGLCGRLLAGYRLSRRSHTGATGYGEFGDGAGSAE